MAELAELNSRLKAKKLDNFYIFTGDEWKVQEIYMAQIAKVSKKQISRIESIYDIVKKRKGNTFIKQSSVYVVRDDKDIMTDEKLQDKLAQIIKDDILILLVSTVDKRKKFYKRYANTIYEFNALEPSNLKKYLKKEIDLSDKNLDKLIEICEGNYGRCLLEIDKIKQYGEHFQDNSVNEFLKTLIEDGTIHVPAKDAIFDFVDAILDNKYEQIFDLYNQCLAVGEATMVMLSVLYNNARAVLQIQTCNNKEIGKSTGLTGWQIMNAKKYLHKWNNDELSHMLEIIQKCESGIKTGKIADDVAMEYVLVNIL